MSYKNFYIYLIELYLKKLIKYHIYKLRNNLKFVIRLFTWDSWVIDEIIFNKEGDTIIDIGAHIGIPSIYAASIIRNGKIYCFEPVGDNFSLLKKNIILNKLNNIFPHKMALTDKVGRCFIYAKKNTKE